MVTTIEQVLRPFFIICFITGADFYPRKQLKSRWIVILSILYCLTIYFSYVYIFYHTMIIFAIKKIKEVGSNMFLTEINIFIWIMFAITSRYYGKKFAICLKKLAIVDDSLEQLGIPKMYHKMHMWSKRIAIGWLICSISTNFYLFFSWFKVMGIISWGLCASHIFHYPFEINTFVDLLFISILWYIGTRFDKINEYMRYLVKKKHGQRCIWMKRVITHHQYVLHTNTYKRTLWILMHIHLELCRLTRELNLIFGIHITLETVSCFSLLIISCEYLCRMAMNEIIDNLSINDRFSYILCTFTILLKFYIINYMCENISIKANQIDEIIHELSSTSQFADIYKEIYQFTLQITYHRLQFTGMGFFYFGNSLLRKLCTTVLTFVIIIRQTNIGI